MKKSIILIIFILYLGAIVMLGFFGMKLTAYQQQIYATEILLMNDDIKSNDSIGQYIEVDYNPELGEEENIYLLQWRVMPEDCTNKRVNFVYDDSKDQIDLQENGIMTIKRKGVVTLKIVSVTTPTVYQIIKIIIK